MTTLWVPVAAIGLPTGFALWLYWLGAAPGLTWAHHGADGGDLLAAAVVGGIPHPSGYPLYTLMLRGWLALGQGLGNTFGLSADLAYWGNRLSALCVAGATGLTVAATAARLHQQAHLRDQRWLWAMLAGLTFAITPLAWSQALITEVYGLHLLLVANLGTLALRLTTPNHSRPVLYLALGVLMGLGAAHHLTSILLWPALLYWSVCVLPWRAWFGVAARIVGVAVVVALPFYGWIIWQVGAQMPPPPIAWGYPRDLAGLWWLVSGEAYRGYVFGMTPLDFGGRLAALARLLVEQFTPVGLALVIGGFAVWDRHNSPLRVGTLLWVLPISLYAAGYNTVDSYVYLLPVVWLMALMMGQGLASGNRWLAQRMGQRRAWGMAQATLTASLIAIGAVVSLGALTILRAPQIELHQDNEAQNFMQSAIATLEPDSLVISSADAPTFALWYGAWGSGDLTHAVPDLVFVNHALYQFGWYRNLMHDHYPEVPMMGASFAELLAANRAVRPIYFTEPLPVVPSTELIPTGAFWRLTPP